MTVADLRSKDGIGPKISNQIYTNLRVALRNVNEAKVFAALSKGLVGEKTARNILQHYPLTTLFGETPLTKGELMMVKGIGDKIATTIIDSHNLIKQQLTFLITQGLTMNRQGIIDLKSDGTPVNPTNGTMHVICLTGGGPLRRDDYMTLIQVKGWNVVGSVTRRTTLLVSTQSSSTSSPTAKVRKAIALGTDIITYKELHTILGIEW